VETTRAVAPAAHDAASRADLRLPRGARCTLLRYEQRARATRAVRPPAGARRGAAGAAGAAGGLEALALAEGESVVVLSHVALEAWGAEWLRVETRDGRRGLVPRAALAEGGAQRRAVLRAPDGEEGTCPVDAFKFEDETCPRSTGSCEIADATADAAADGAGGGEAVAGGSGGEGAVVAKCRRAALALLAALEARGDDALTAREAAAQRQASAPLRPPPLPSSRAVDIPSRLPAACGRAVGAPGRARTRCTER
jgi:hypothetical protein